MSVLVVDRSNAESLDGGVPGLNNSITLGKPNFVQNGDVLVAVLACTDDNNFTSVPVGFTLTERRTTSGNTDRGLHVYHKVITDAGSEPSTYSWALSQNEFIQGCLYNLRGVYTADPIDAISEQNNGNTGTNVDVLSVTTSENNAFLLQCVMVAGAKAGTIGGPWTAPGTIIKDYDLGPLPASNGDVDLFVYLGTGHRTFVTAGATGLFQWQHSTGSGSDDISIHIAFNSAADYSASSSSASGTPPVGGCTCNAICDNDCGSNQICTGHVPVCSNDFTFTGIAIGTIVRASHLLELQTAINLERADSGRRFNANEPAYCFTHSLNNLACLSNQFDSWPWIGGVGVGEAVDDRHYIDVKEANNEVVNESGYGTLVTTNFISQNDDVSVGKVLSIIKAADVTDLQNKINATRNACICDSHCNCDPSDCGCNGECPNDDYYYYYYYYYYS